MRQRQPEIAKNMLHSFAFSPLKSEDAMKDDQLLWTRGHEPRYRNSPRHHTRTRFY